MNDYELLEGDILWQNGDKDTVLLTELHNYSDVKIEIERNTDDNWRDF